MSDLPVLLTREGLTFDAVREPRCPICHYEWDNWMSCNHPGCHDGRLPKPKPDTRPQRAGGEIMTNEASGWLNIAADYERRLTEAEAEVERLRAALKRAVDPSDDGWLDEARAALEGK